jgi:hypothetical protein
MVEWKSARPNAWKNLNVRMVDRRRPLLSWHWTNWFWGKLWRETTNPHLTPSVHWTSSAGSWGIGATGQSCDRATEIDLTIYSDCQGRWRSSPDRNHQIGNQIWPLWISASRSLTGGRRLANQPKARRKDLAAGGAKSSKETAEARPPVA